MSATPSDLQKNDQTNATPPVPKRLTNAQTVCNEKNEKGKLCNGHLKQLRTAGEPAEIHLRGDDVLFKCQTCGTFYMGPPLGHVRDPDKQHRFVEAELTALLQAAGGTLPIVKKDARGVFVLEAAGEHAPAPAKPSAAKAAAPPKSTPTTANLSPTPAAQTAPAPAAATVDKPGSAPNRSLFRRSSYSGVEDTGPVPGESFEQKVARLKAVAVAAKKRAEEGGGDVAAPAPAQQVAPPPSEISVEPVVTTTPEAPSPTTTAPAPTNPPAAHTPIGQADRSLMRRSTYSGVVDSGPVPGETFAQKVERLTKLAAAAKQRSEEGGG